MVRIMEYDGHRVALAGEDLPGAGALHHRHHVPPLLPHPRRVPRQLGVRGHPAALRIAGTGGAPCTPPLLKVPHLA